MSTVDEFLKAEKRLREQQERAVQRQREWDDWPTHWTGMALLKFFAVCVALATVAGIAVWFWMAL